MINQNLSHPELKFVYIINTCLCTVHINFEFKSTYTFKLLRQLRITKHWERSLLAVLLKNQHVFGSFSGKALNTHMVSVIRALCLFVFICPPFCMMFSEQRQASQPRRHDVSPGSGAPPDSEIGQVSKNRPREGLPLTFTAPPPFSSQFTGSNIRTYPNKNGCFCWSVDSWVPACYCNCVLGKCLLKGSTYFLSEVYVLFTEVDVVEILIS